MDELTKRLNSTLAGSKNTVAELGKAQVENEEFQETITALTEQVQIIAPLPSARSRLSPPRWCHGSAFLAGRQTFLLLVIVAISRQTLTPQRHSHHVDPSIHPHPHKKVKTLASQGGVAHTLQEQLNQGMMAYEALQGEVETAATERDRLDEQLKRHLGIAAEQKTTSEFDLTKLRQEVEDLTSSNKKLEKKLTKAKDKQADQKDANEAELEDLCHENEDLQEAQAELEKKLAAAEADGGARRPGREAKCCSGGRPASSGVSYCRT